MSIILAKPIPPLPAPPIPMLLAGVQAQGQVAGSSYVPSITSGIFTNSMITTTASTGFMTGGSGYVVVNAVAPPRKPRRPREKRTIPLFTAGLEAKLNKNLDRDATQVLRYLARKVEQQPTIVDSTSHFVYEFNAVFQYAYQTGVSWNTNQPLPPMSTHLVKFFARLIVRNDGTLREFEIRMAGERS